MVPWIDRYLPTGFAQRLTQEIEAVRSARTARVVFAESGAGKSRVRYQVVASSGGFKEPGQTVQPVITARIPHRGSGTADKLMAELARDCGFGGISVGRARALLPGYMRDAGTEVVVIDDCHEMSGPQVDVIRELDDELEGLGVRVGWVLLAAMASRDPRECRPVTWLMDPDSLAPGWHRGPNREVSAFQFTRRLDVDDPWVHVDGLDPDELADVLATFDVMYADAIPGLDLESVTDELFEALTVPRIDWLETGTVRMNAVVHVVKILFRSIEERGGRARVTGVDVHRAVEAYAFRHARFVRVTNGRRGRPRRSRIG